MNILEAAAGMVLFAGLIAIVGLPIVVVFSAIHRLAGDHGNPTVTTHDGPVAGGRCPVEGCSHFLTHGLRGKPLCAAHGYLHERGQALVEFALAVPLFFALILGGLALGWTMLTMMSMENEADTLADLREQHDSFASLQASTDYVLWLDNLQTKAPRCVNPIVQEVALSGGLYDLSLTCTTSPIVPETATDLTVTVSGAVIQEVTPSPSPQP